MTKLSDRIDHFLRWFIDSSPEVSHFEPRPKPTQRREAGDGKRPPPARDGLREAARRVPTRRGAERSGRLDISRCHSAKAASHSPGCRGARASA